GAAFGNAVHAVFEHRHPGVPITAQLQLVRASLQEHAVALGELPLERAAELVAARVQACLEHPIGEGLRLGDLPGHALRAEMGFHYVLDGVDMERLRLACAEAGAPELVPRVRVRELNGLMTGKIDLLFEHAGRFHLLDYKGN